jgi:hypothetical protein
MKYVNFSASNLAESETIPTNGNGNHNSVFNPALYEMAGGKIETFDPAYASRERARQREAARQKDRMLVAQRKAIRKAKMKRQRFVGGLLIAIADVFSLVYLDCGSNCYIYAAVILLIMGLIPLMSKKPLFL